MTKLITSIVTLTLAFGLAGTASSNAMPQGQILEQTGLTSMFQGGVGAVSIPLLQTQEETGIGLMTVTLEIHDIRDYQAQGFKALPATDNDPGLAYFQKKMGEWSNQPRTDKSAGLLTKFDEVDGWTGAAPDSGMAYPVPARDPFKILVARVNIKANKLHTDKQGRPMASGRFNLGNAYVNLLRIGGGFIALMPCRMISASMRELSLLMDFQAGRSYTFPLGKAFDNVPVLGRMLTFGKNSAGRVGSGFVLALLRPEEDLSNYEDFVKWQMDWASIIMQGAPGAVGGIVPLRATRKLMQMLTSYRSPMMSTPAIGPNGMTITGTPKIDPPTEPVYEAQAPTIFVSKGKVLVTSNTEALITFETSRPINGKLSNSTLLTPAKNETMSARLPVPVKLTICWKKDGVEQTPIILTERELKEMETDG